MGQCGVLRGRGPQVRACFSNPSFRTRAPDLAGRLLGVRGAGAAWVLGAGGCASWLARGDGAVGAWGGLREDAATMCTGGAYRPTFRRLTPVPQSAFFRAYFMCRFRRLFGPVAVRVCLSLGPVLLGALTRVK